MDCWLSRSKKIKGDLTVTQTYFTKTVFMRLHFFLAMDHFPFLLSYHQDCTLGPKQDQKPFMPSAFVCKIHLDQRFNQLAS